MVKGEFKRIAEKEGGKLSYQDKDISIGGGVKSPKLVFLLKINHKGHDISIVNETGTSFVAKITCHLPVSKTSLNFDLTTKSHLSTLFSRTKNRFKIDSNNSNLDAFIKNDLALKQLNALANETTFAPSISGNYNEDSYTLVTKYHLQFSDWTQVIEPLIAFYRAFIDEFGE